MSFEKGGDTVVNVLSETTVAILNPLQAIWLKLVEVLPGLIAAVLVLIVGSIVAVILGHALRVVLEKTKIDNFLRKAQLTKAVGHTHVPALLGELLKWYIIIIFLQAAASLVNLGTLSTLLNSLVMWLPQLLIAIIVMLIGLAAAHYAYLRIGAHTKMKGMRLSATVLKWVIIIIAGLIALKQIGVEIGILENTFQLVVGALAVGVALALGIGLGLGLKKEAEGFLKEMKKNL